MKKYVIILIVAMMLAACGKDEKNMSNSVPEPESKNVVIEEEYNPKLVAKDSEVISVSADENSMTETSFWDFWEVEDRFKIKIKLVEKVTTDALDAEFIKISYYMENYGYGDMGDSLYIEKVLDGQGEMASRDDIEYLGIEEQDASSIPIGDNWPELVALYKLKNPSKSVTIYFTYNTEDGKIIQASFVCPVLQ